MSREILNRKVRKELRKGRKGKNWNQYLATGTGKL